MNPHFYFAAPDELLLHETAQPHGDTIYVYCRECGGKAMFNLDKRDGHCFSCERIFKLHKMYQEMSDEDLLDVFGVDLTSSHDSGGRRPETVAREPENIIPGPLSPHALQYIASRGITEQTLSNLPILRETTHWGRQWLCWRNVADSYELRAIGGSDKSMPRGSTKTYSQAHIRPELKTLVICEGIFSTLSYAQLFHYVPDIYITLNSVSTVRKVVDALPTWVECGVGQIILALDVDEAGMKAMKALYTACRGTVAVRVHFPETPHSCDWNDQLMEMMQQ